MECATMYMIDFMIDVAIAWPDRCGEVGIDDRQTERLAQMLRTRLESLK